MSRGKVAKSASCEQPNHALGKSTNRHRLTRVGLAFLMLGSLDGCPAPYVPQPDPNIRILWNRVKVLETTIGILNQEINNVERTYWSERLCQKSRDKITAFVNEVQKGSPEVCKPMELEKALAFMNSQAVAYAYLDKEIGLSSLHSAREGYIRDNLLSELNLHPSTRVLILVQPYANTPAAVQKSQDIAKALTDKIRGDLPTVPNRPVPPILGPYLLPCNLQSESSLTRLYGGSQFTRLSDSLPGEPNAKQPRVRIWVFRTDCQ